MGNDLFGGILMSGSAWLALHQQLSPWLFFILLIGDLLVVPFTRFNEQDPSPWLHFNLSDRKPSPFWVSLSRNLLLFYMDLRIHNATRIDTSPSHGLILLLSFDTHRISGYPDFGDLFCCSHFILLGGAIYCTNDLD